MKTSTLDLHAYASSPAEHYHPWLAEQIKLSNNDISTPTLPGNIEPDFQEWLQISQEAFNNLKASNPDKINLTARSLGCWTALKLAETNQIDAMVMVAPAFPIVFKQKSLRDKFIAWKPESIPVLDTFSSNEVDLEKASKNCKKIVFFLSDNDPYVKVDLVMPIINQFFPNAEVKIFPNSDHFKANAGDGNRSFEQFPELLEELI